MFLFFDSMMMFFFKMEHSSFFRHVIEELTKKIDDLTAAFEDEKFRHKLEIKQVRVLEKASLLIFKFADFKVMSHHGTFQFYKQNFQMCL